MPANPIHFIPAQATESAIPAVQAPPELQPRQPVYFEAHGLRDTHLQLEEFRQSGQLGHCTHQLCNTIQQIIDHLERWHEDRESTGTTPNSDAIEPWYDFKNRIAELANHPHLGGSINTATLLGPVKRMIEQLLAQCLSANANPAQLSGALENVAARLPLCSTGIQKECQDALLALNSGLSNRYAQVRQTLAESTIQAVCHALYGQQMYYDNNELHLVQGFLNEMADLGLQTMVDHYAGQPEASEVAQVRAQVIEHLANGAALRQLADQIHAEFCSRALALQHGDMPVIHERLLTQAQLECSAEVSTLMQQVCEAMQTLHELPPVAWWDFFLFNGCDYRLPQHATGRLIHALKNTLQHDISVPEELELQAVGQFTTTSPSQGESGKTCQVHYHENNWWITQPAHDSGGPAEDVLELDADHLQQWIRQTDSQTLLRDTLLPAIQQHIKHNPNDDLVLETLLARAKVLFQRTVLNDSPQTDQTRRFISASRAWLELCLARGFAEGVAFLLDSLDTENQTAIAHAVGDTEWIQLMETLHAVRPDLCKKLLPSATPHRHSALMLHAIQTDHIDLFQDVAQWHQDDEHNNRISPLMMAMECDAFDMAQMIASTPLHCWTTLTTAVQALKFAAYPYSNHDARRRYQVLRRFQREALADPTVRNQLLNELSRTARAGQWTAHHLLATSVLHSLHDIQSAAIPRDFDQQIAHALDTDRAFEQAQFMPLLNILLCNTLAKRPDADLPLLQHRQGMAIQHLCNWVSQGNTTNPQPYALAVQNLLACSSVYPPGALLESPQTLGRLLSLHSGQAPGPELLQLLRVAPGFAILNTVHEQFKRHEPLRAQARDMGLRTLNALRAQRVLLDNRRPAAAVFQELLMDELQLDRQFRLGMNAEQKALYVRLLKDFNGLVVDAGEFMAHRPPVKPRLSHILELAGQLLNDPDALLDVLASWEEELASDPSQARWAAPLHTNHGPVESLFIQDLWLHMAQHFQQHAPLARLKYTESVLRQLNQMPITAPMDHQDAESSLERLSTRLRQWHLAYGFVDRALRHQSHRTWIEATLRSIHRLSEQLAQRTGLPAAPLHDLRTLTQQVLHDMQEAADHHMPGPA
ncbi:hypothetical protein NQT62_14060 [Limnobacter humi]|uniref:Uncharacterized protein n=1 Tax=Limnobacter humi TaxID=1778671 RepID=A0ABT1WKR5_9BURK|nr:hypothetical protein [Limnobacter humi]MCQ8897562.1 hypothetical protein [Limnobacter humi]